MSYEACCEAFDATLPEGAPLNPWQKLQDELYRWQVRTYGVPDPREMALGIVEEFGELAEADDSDEHDDAVADVGVFATQLATVFRLDVGEVVREGAWLAGRIFPKARGLAWTRDGIARAGRLCHVVLKASQGIRGMGDPEKARAAVYTALAAVFAVLVQQSAKPTEACLFANVSATAAKVMARKKASLPQVAR